jgi:hypothetical protein
VVSAKFCHGGCRLAVDESTNLQTQHGNIRPATTIK